MEESQYRKYYVNNDTSRWLAANLTDDLRPLKSMTDSEAIGLAKLTAKPEEFHSVKVFRNKHDDVVITWGQSGEFVNATGELFYTPAQFHYLLSKRFDVFGINA